MAQFDRQAYGRPTVAAGTDIDQGLRSYMLRVYNYMAIGLGITGVVAFAAAAMAVSGGQLTAFGQAIFLSPLKWVIMLAPLAVVFGMSAGINRLSEAGLQGVFWLFSALMGLSLSSIFLVFTGYSIVQVFLVTAIAFAGLSLWGYTTKKDISAWGSFLVMGVIGLIVAMLVNIFLASPAVAFAISAIGVLIFAGLTAYDTQKIKTTYLEMRGTEGEAYLGKAAIMGALSLYLDFINMFMFLLQLFGNRN